MTTMPTTPATLPEPAPSYEERALAARMEARLDAFLSRRTSVLTG